MEFSCAQCQTVYQVPEHKLPPRKVLAKCKRCGANVLIDPESAKPANGEQQPGLAEGSAPSTQRMPESSPPPEDRHEEDWTAYIGPNAHRYLKQFGKFGSPSAPRFALTWHWPAFLVGWLWLLYRKMYLWAGLALLLVLVPGINLLSVFVWGMLGHYVYWRHARRKILELRASYPHDNLTITLAQIGGVHRWVVALGIGLIALFLAGLVMVRLGQ